MHAAVALGRVPAQHGASLDNPPGAVSIFGKGVFAQLGDDHGKGVPLVKTACEPGPVSNARVCLKAVGIRHAVDSVL